MFCAQERAQIKEQSRPLLTRLLGRLYSAGRKRIAPYISKWVKYKNDGEPTDPGSQQRNGGQCA
jgi:hypothetical protein